jgi:pyruvate dehydrogenase E1 component alpha subunit
VDKAFATDDIASRAIGYGMPGVNVDARDVRLVYAVAGEAIALARAGGGPTLIVAEAYRHDGHYYGDPQHYRTKEEIEAWRTTFDPIINARAWLTSDGLATEAEIDAIDREVDEETEAAIVWAEAGPIASAITLEEIHASY